MQLEVQGHYDKSGALKHDDLMNIIKWFLALERLLNISWFVFKGILIKCWNRTQRLFIQNMKTLNSVASVILEETKYRKTRSLQTKKKAEDSKVHITRSTNTQIHTLSLQYRGGTDPGKQVTASGESKWTQFQVKGEVISHGW